MADAAEMKRAKASLRSKHIRTLEVLQTTVDENNKLKDELEKCKDAAEENKVARAQPAATAAASPSTTPHLCRAARARTDSALASSSSSFTGRPARCCGSSSRRSKTSV